MEPNKNNSAKVASVLALIIVAASVIFYSAQNFSKQEDAKEVASVSETPAAGNRDDDQMPTETPVTTPVSTPPVSTPSTKPSIPPSKKPTPTPAKTTKYQNGSYSASGVYATPEGGESIDVTLTIKDDIIVDANVTGNSSMFSTSGNYQRRFISGYKQYVVGKKLDSVQLSAVSGASLTSNGFNTALARIKAQAKA